MSWPYRSTNRGVEAVTAYARAPVLLDCTNKVAVSSQLFHSHTVTPYKVSLQLCQGFGCLLTGQLSAPTRADRRCKIAGVNVVFQGFKAEVGKSLIVDAKHIYNHSMEIACNPLHM